MSERSITRTVTTAQGAQVDLALVCSAAGGCIQTHHHFRVSNGSFVSFDNLDDSWFQARKAFEVVLYHSVIRQSSREKLPSLYADVEREIAPHLFHVDPDRYPEYRGSLGMMRFDEYPIEERREFLRAAREGVKEIRSLESPEKHYWNSDYRDRYVRMGEERIKMMERSLALAEGADGSDAPSPAISGESAP